METLGADSSTTVIVWVTVVSFPAPSRATTVTDLSPSVLVSSCPPSGVVPWQEARPDPPWSAQEKSTTTDAPRGTRALSAGLRRSTVGAVVSGGMQLAEPVMAIRYSPGAPASRPAQPASGRRDPKPLAFSTPSGYAWSLNLSWKISPWSLCGSTLKELIAR